MKSKRRKPNKPKRRTVRSAPRSRSTAAARDTKQARLGRELREALDSQAATVEVLKIISNSPGELDPVFDAILENATRICSAKFGILYLYESGKFRPAALASPTPEFEAYVKERGVFAPHPNQPLGQLLRTKTVVQAFNDTEEGPWTASFKFGGARTFIAVPMLRENELVGSINIFRQEARLFTEKQIALVSNFAAQAVIAIENSRLFEAEKQRTSELTESLEQQTATSEVLKVISSSHGELQPVFDVILENATRICEAKFGNLTLYEDDVFRRVAVCNAPPAWAADLQREPRRHRKEAPVLYRIADTKETLHVANIEVEYPDETIGKLTGARTLLLVPMLKAGALIGTIGIYRQEVRPFSEKQVALLKSFADQAVIAIENARLLNELRESLQQQTATADVLKVISSSPGELEPVFQTMLENAVRICEANFGNLMLRDGDSFRVGATHGAPPAYVDFLHREGPFHADPRFGLGQLLRTKQTYQVADVSAAATHGDKLRMATIELAGGRTLIGVPMLKDGEVIGSIIIYRQEVRPFTEKQIELVQNFAAQAVIAIENTRLLNELRESLQQQTATADVLKVISRSTFDLQTVLDTLVESAARLCEADMASVNRQAGEVYRQVASYGYSPEFKQFMTTHPLEMGRGTLAGRVVLGGKAIQVVDVLADPEYKFKEGAKVGGTRTMLGVPLLREGMPVGVIVLSRRAVQPFTDKQIELVSTFADQAVIAIENVRLFEAEQQRTRELAKSLEDLRTAQDRLVQTEKLASLGQLTAGIAHEIKNPLNFVNNFSSVSVELIGELQETLGQVKADDKTRAEIAELADTLRDNLDKIVQHGKRADSIVKNMLLHSREGSGERRLVDVNALVEESLNLAYHGARAEKQGFNISIERTFDPAAGEVDVFPQEITRVLLNLIANGFYAATKRQAQAADEAFEPTVSAATKNLGDRVAIRIRDNGAGIPPDVKEKMFNPFFTTKPAGEGTGLGLSISHDIIVKQHSGSIEVDSRPGEFTEFRIILPRTAAVPAKSGDRARGLSLS
jgi:two-component system, NtrC family, sensor kinase